MEVTPGEIIIEPATNRPAQPSQPTQALGVLEAPMDDNQVRAAIANAEANNMDPQTLTLQDLAQVPVVNPSVQATAPSPVEVPQKFLKPDGVVDVEKIQASTKQLDVVIQQKEEALTKTVDDYMKEYTERETKFRTMPNPTKLAAQLPQTPPPIAQAPVTDPSNFEEVVRRDYAIDPLGTTTRLLDLMIQDKFRPIEEKEKIEATRSNIQRLAEKDPRVLRQDVYNNIQAKLQSDPDFWKLKNPHKAAWLEVKEEMRLGEPSQVQAQPSRPSPVLGGGTPPSAPSSSAPQPQNIAANLHRLDLRDKKQEDAGDAAVRAMLAGHRG